MTLPTTRRQTTANANTNTKKLHRQEENQEDDNVDDVDAGNGVGAINGNGAINTAIDYVKAVNASKAAEAINVITEVTAVKAVVNTKGDVNHYATALIHSLNVHQDAMNVTTSAKNMKKGHATVSAESAVLPF